MDVSELLKEVPEGERDAVAYRLQRAMSERTPPSVLKDLTKDPHWFVRNQVASNKGTPEGCVQELSHDPDLRVRDSAYKNLQRMGLRSVEQGGKPSLLAQIQAAEKQKNIASEKGKEKVQEFGER